MLFQKARKIGKGKIKVKLAEIYDNSRVEIFEFDGGRYLIDADFLKGVDNESQLRLKLKKCGGQRKTLIYKIENHGDFLRDPKISPLIKAIEEDRELRTILFDRARKTKSIKFYPRPTYTGEKGYSDFSEIKQGQFSSNYGAH